MKMKCGIMKWEIESRCCKTGCFVVYCVHRAARLFELYIRILCLIGQGIFCLLLIVVLHWLYCNEVKSKHNLTKERNGRIMHG